MGPFLEHEETPEYSLGGWLFETLYLGWVVLVLFGVLLELSIEIWLGLFIEQFVPEDTRWASVGEGAANRWGWRTGRIGRFAVEAANDVVFPTLGWNSVIGPGCWAEGAGSWIVEAASPLEKENDQL